jgi:hypothetical protein
MVSASVHMLTPVHILPVFMKTNIVSFYGLCVLSLFPALFVFLYCSLASTLARVLLLPAV